MTSYLTSSAARTLAAGLAALPGFADLLALDDTTLGGMLLTASLDIDAAGPYQGRKYDDGTGIVVNSTPGVPQAMEFPRVPDDGANSWPAGVSPFTGPGIYTVIQDWDPVNNVAIVPDMVKLATLYQAAWLMQPQYAARLEAIRSGLAAQSTGEASETNVKTGEAVPGGFTSLGDRASKIMERYRIKTGRLL